MCLTSLKGLLQPHLVSADFSKRCMSPQVAECSLNAARVVELLEMFLHVEHLGFYLCILSEAASPDGGVTGR